MMRSLYSAVSGLKTHQTKMDVIGNNIANVNTEAFKASSVRFSEIMYQTTASASAGNGAAGTGGVNAKQIGLGVTTGSTTVSITSAGAAETTGNPFDLKLTDKQSTNFFIVSDGANTYFTRAGDFYVDGNGYLCMSSTGYTLMGWQVDPATGDIKRDLVSSLQVMSPENQTSPPEATTKAYVKGVLDKNERGAASDDGYTITLGFFDDLGYSYTAKFALKEIADNDGAYSIQLTDIIDSDSQSILLDGDGNITQDAFNSLPEATRNAIYAAAGLDPAAGFPTTAEGLAALTNATCNSLFQANQIVFDRNEGQFVSINDPSTADNDTAMLNISSLLTGHFSADGNVSNFENISIDFSATLNYNNGGTSTIKMLAGDTQGDGKGKKLGALSGITVSDDGRIYGSYDNGNTVLLCQISVAQFANASGLEKVGNNCYQTTLNSGEFDGIGVDISADGSAISTGELEMSNVDLSSQFTDMIVTQRGFQANSRVITTSDTLLEELINLKR
ncbi:MAG: flagellar hook-basal body complex protein [Agathobacter sp.]|nr:flagellar hook-basal body complex protein [Agathobacter sp.]